MIRPGLALCLVFLVTACGDGGDHASFGLGQNGLALTIPTGAIKTAPVPRRQGDIFRWDLQ